MRHSALAFRISHLLLGILAVISMLSCSRVPLTGRSRLLLIPYETELRLGSETYAEVISNSKLSEDSLAVARIRTIGQRISNVSGATDYRWEFNLIEADSVYNAFCLPGGKVAVYTGILKIANTDAQLATVMSHEIAHAIARHGAERMSQLLMLQLGGIALDEALKTKSERTIQLAQIAYGAGTGLLYLLPYSRKHESEADRIGLILMAKANYNPAAAIEFWERMQNEVAGSEPPQFLSTHPGSEKRIEDLKRWLPEALQYYQGEK
ncbi:MAG: M48 family metallopeptidase [bacterium]